MSHYLSIVDVEFAPTGGNLYTGYCEECFDGSNGWFGTSEDVHDQFKEHVNG